jgi:hypothetical protein
VDTSFIRQQLRQLREQRDALDALAEALRTQDGWLSYRAEALLHCLATWGSMACNAAELAAVLAVLAMVLSLRRVPYWNRGGFEGEGVMVSRGVLKRARGSC